MNFGSPQHQNQFCVRWNSHLGSIGASFPKLLAGQHFIDVTLACEGHQLHCHRLVLASCSTFFDSLLRENPCEHPIIILPPEIKLWEIQALIDFMYKGEVNVSQSGLEALLKSAAILQICGLSGADTMFNLDHVTNSSNGCGGVSSVPSPIPSSSSTSPTMNGANTAKNLMSMNLNEQITSQSSGNNSAVGGCGSPGSPLPTNESGLVSNNNGNASGLIRNFRKNNEQHESGHSSPSSASSPINQSADINNSRQDPPIKKRTSSSAFGSGGIGDDDGMSLMKQQANYGLSLCDKVLTPKEEPLDINADVSIEDDINASSNEPLEGQDEMLQHRHNQTEQQVQEQDYEQNNCMQNNNNNINNNSNNNNNNSSIENILQKFKQRNNDDKNVVIIKNEISNVNSKHFNCNNNNNNDNDKTCNSNSKTKKMKLCDNNNGNESDSSSYSVVIIENEVPMIEIFDNDEDDRNNHFINDNLNSNKINVTKRKLIMQEATVTKGQNGNRNNSGRIRVKSSENLFENLSNGGMSGNITIRRQQQQQRHEVKLPLNNSNRPSSSSMLSLLPKLSHSKSNGKLLESRNQMLPSSLKFDSQSMAIYVKPAVSISETCTISNSSSTLNSSSLLAYLKGTNNDPHKTSQEQQNQPQQQQQKRSTHRNITKKTQIKVKNDVEINDACNYENIICAPNVSDFCNSEFVPSYEYVKVNFDDIQIDENFYNLNSEYSEVSNVEELSESSLPVNEYWKRLSKQQTSNSRTMRNTCTSSETKATNTNIRRTAANSNNSRSLLRNTNTSAVNSGPSTSTTSTTGGGKNNNNNNNLSSLMNCLPNGVPSPSAVVLRNPRSNQPRSYSTDALYAALMDVKGGESIYRASQIHKVPRKTLRNWMKRWHIKSAYPMPRQLKQAAEKKKLKQMKNEK